MASTPTFQPLLHLPFPRNLSQRVASPHPPSHEDDELERMSSRCFKSPLEAEEGRPGLHSGQAPHFTIQICITRHVAACCLEHVTLAETGLDADGVLPWTRALAEQEQAVAMELGPEREDPTLHSPRTPKADSPPSLLKRARGRSLCMAYGQGSSPYCQLSYSSAAPLPMVDLHQRWSCGKTVHSFLFKKPTVAAGHLRPGPPREPGSSLR